MNKKGRIVNINNNTYDIYIEEDNNIRKNVLLDKKYQLYQVINYIEYEPIFFNVNISYNGNIKVLSGYSINEKKIKEKLDYLFNKIKNTNYLFNNKFIHLNYKLFENKQEFIINSSYKLPENHGLPNLETLNKIIYCFIK